MWYKLVYVVQTCVPDLIYYVVQTCVPYLIYYMVQTCVPDLIYYVVQTCVPYLIYYVVQYYLCTCMHLYFIVLYVIYNISTPAKERNKPCD